MGSTRLAAVVLCAATSLLFAASATAAPRYVDDGGSGGAPCSNPANPCPTIALANGAAGPGDVIQVGGGAYAGSTLGSGISLVETNFSPPSTAGEAVIDGAASNGVLVAAGAAREIRGLTIEGDADAIELQGGAGGTTVSIIGNTFPSRDNQFDSRIQISNGAGAANVTIEGNAWTWGAAVDTSINRIGVDDQTTGPLNAVVRNNSFDAVASPMTFVGSDPLIAGNTMTRVYDDPGGNRRAIDLTDSSATVEGNSIAADSTSALGIVAANSGATADALVLRRNSVTGFDSDALNVRGALGTSDTVTVTESLFTVTSSAFPFSARDLDGLDSLSVRGVTLDKPSGSPFYLQDAVLRLDSSILSGGISTFDTTSCTSTFSRSSTTGTPGNLTDCNDFATTAPPGFVGGGDFRLAAGSAMIDGGNPFAGSALDLAGNPRALLGTPACAQTPGRRDIGAYEFVAATGVGCPAAAPAPAKKCKKTKKGKKGSAAAKKCKKKKKKSK